MTDSADGWVAADWPAPSNIIAGTTLRNYESEELPVPGRPLWLQQVHGTKVIVGGDYETCEEGNLPEADASVSRADGDVCVVRTADCLPVLLCSDSGDAFGAAHAGWRGMVGGVIEKTVAALDEPPEHLMAWFGPAISQPAFEVGAEVREAFLAADSEATRFFAENERGRFQADLYGLARQRLASVGVTRVYGGGLCTFSDDSQYFSYRRQPDCGRHFSFVARQSP